MSSSKTALLLSVIAYGAMTLVAHGAALELEESRSGKFYDCVVLKENSFTLSFVHSVSLTPVEDIYEVSEKADGSLDILQTEERFIAHGQGLPSMNGEPDARKFEYHDNKFVLYMNRPIGDLIIRLDSRFKNRLHTGMDVINLNQWPDYSGLRIKPVKSCHEG
ncbi:MAG: DUF1850 domain-containing protein [Sneathiella sp.]|nr:DUF1850 domain-containing protein [Sneathiella sp.]